MQRQIDMLRVVELLGELDEKTVDGGNGVPVAAQNLLVVRCWEIEIRWLREPGCIERGNCMKVSG